MGPCTAAIVSRTGGVVASRSEGDDLKVSNVSLLVRTYIVRTYPLNGEGLGRQYGTVHTAAMP
jgi:hypothetical protein